jgi:hypothetical protein
VLLAFTGEYIVVHTMARRQEQPLLEPTIMANQPAAIIRTGLAIEAVAHRRFDIVR